MTTTASMSRLEYGVAAALRHGALLAGWNLLIYTRNPSSIAGAVVFPLIFFFGFYRVLHRSLGARGVDYAQYLPPVVVVQTMFFTAISSAFFLADDKLRGLLERCRALPVHRAAPLVGRIAADLVRALVSTAVVLAAAVTVGFRFDAGPVAAAGFVVVVLLFTLVAAVGCGAVGLTAASPETVTSTLFLPYLPLLMLSTGFVPADGFPGWLQPFVRWQPVSLTVEALCALSSGGPTAVAVARALIVLVALAAIFGWLAMRAYRRAA